MKTPIEPDQIISVDYPFSRTMVHLFDGEGTCEVKSWKPGVSQKVDPYSDGLYADGMGKMILNVVSVHKPGKYPNRVFFTRKWIDPDGKQFGKPCLRVKSEHFFREMTSGYRHEFAVGV